MMWRVVPVALLAVVVWLASGPASAAYQAEDAISSVPLPVLAIPPADLSSESTFERTEPEVQIARKGRRGAGRRGGVGRKRPGGFNEGNRRAGDRDYSNSRNLDVDKDVNVDVDRDIDVDGDIDGDWDDDDNEAGAALVGGVIGLGVGVAIANSDDPDYTCPDANLDGVCDNAVNEY